MASLFDAVTTYLDAGQRVTDLCKQLGVKLTPFDIALVRFLGQNPQSAAPEIARGAAINLNTVRDSIKRLMELKRPLVAYVSPPRPGRPSDTGTYHGKLKLTPEGLRLYDRMKKCM